MNRLLLGSLLAGLLAGCGGSVLPQIHDERGRVDLARRLYEKGDPMMAIQVLAPYSSSGSGSADVDEAVYLLGLCHLKTKEYATAQGDLERLLRDYPESDSAASAAFRLGEAFWGQSRGPDFDQEYTLRSLEQWLGYRRDFPEHWLGPTAQRRIAEARTRLATKLYRTGDLYVKLREYEPARTYFRHVLSEYSETPLYGDAMIGWAIASARLGERDSAVAVLRELEQEFAGRPLGQKAARARADVQKFKLPKDAFKRRNTPNEPPPLASPGGGPP